MSFTHVRWSLAVATMLSLGGCDSGSSGASASPEAAYLQHCSACHQPQGRGLAGAFPPLAASDWLRAASSEETIGLVLRGRAGPMRVNGVDYNGAMPAFAHLDDTTVADVLNHVYASWGNDGRRVSPAEVAAERGAAR